MQTTYYWMFSQLYEIGVNLLIDVLSITVYKPVSVPYIFTNDILHHDHQTLCLASILIHYSYGQFSPNVRQNEIFRILP